MLADRIRLLETIRIEEATPHLLELHEARMRRALQSLCPQSRLLSRLEQEGIWGLLEPHLDMSNLYEGVYKLRMIYTPEGVESIRVEPYRKSLYDRIRLVPLPPEGDYTHKYADRRWLDTKAKCGEIPIFLRGDRLTDTHFSNILLLKAGQWLTPREPLLRGVMREHLIRQELIHEADLCVSDLKKGTIIRLINAMLPLQGGTQMEIMHREEETLEVFISLI